MFFLTFRNINIIGVSCRDRRRWRRLWEKKKTMQSKPTLTCTCLMSHPNSNSLSFPPALSLSLSLSLSFSPVQLIPQKPKKLPTVSYIHWRGIRQGPGRGRRPRQGPMRCTPTVNVGKLFSNAPRLAQIISAARSWLQWLIVVLSREPCKKIGEIPFSDFSRLGGKYRVWIFTLGDSRGSTGKSTLDSDHLFVFRSSGDMGEVSLPVLTWLCFASPCLNCNRRHQQNNLHKQDMFRAYVREEHYQQPTLHKPSHYTTYPPPPPPRGSLPVPCFRPGIPSSQYWNPGNFRKRLIFVMLASLWNLWKLITYWLIFHD